MSEAKQSPWGNILITGGSGFIGQHFFQYLDPEKTVNIDLLATPGLPLQIQGNICIENDIEQALDQLPCHTILSLAAEHKDFGISREAYFQTNEQATRLLCEAATRRGIRRFVFFSSVAVYGDHHTPSDEQMPPAPVNPYGQSKWAGEQVLRQWAEADPTRSVLIIRPAVVYGEGNVANMYRLIQQIRAGRYFHVGKGDNVKSIAYVRNLVDATLFLMRNMQAGVQVYNYADEPQLSSREIADTIARALGKSTPITLPFSLLRWMALPFDLAILLSGKDLPVSSKRLKKFCTETFHRADKIRQEGFVPAYDNLQGLERMVAWVNQSDLIKPQQIPQTKI